jgi:hypothetical protein
MSYKLIEQPMIRLGARLLKKKTSTELEAVAV